MGYIETVSFASSGGQTINPSTEELQNLITLLLDRLDYGLLTDNAKRLRIVVDTGVITLPTTQDLRTITTVSNLTNMVRIGDIQSQRVVEAQFDSSFILGITNNITF